MGLGTAGLETRGKWRDGSGAASTSTLDFPAPGTMRHGRLSSQAPDDSDFSSELRRDPSLREMRTGGTDHVLGHTARLGQEPP